MTRDQIKALNALQLAPAAMEVVPTNSGKIVLVDGTTITGSWVIYGSDHIMYLRDSSNIDWWIDIDQITAFCPQP